MPNPELTFDQAISQFTALPGRLETVTTEAFQALFGSAEARQRHETGLVYILLAAVPVPRLVGESRVLYIGQTIQSMYGRYHKWSGTLAGSAFNHFKYSQVVSRYGGMQLLIASPELFGDSPRAAEAWLLSACRMCHGETPPFNG